MSEKYGITDAHYLCDSAIFNTETEEILRLYQICDLLNQQDQEIKTLKERLKDFSKFRENDLKEIDRLVKLTQSQKQQLENAISYCQIKIDNINNIYPEGAVISEWFSREYSIYKEMLKELQGENK